MEFLSNPQSVVFWVAWAAFLVWQNYAFTFVSRARNSGSLRRHMVAALQSNGVWFIQTLFVFTAFKAIIEGRYGWRMALFAALYYTAFTMAGSIYAHHRALNKESGMSAVGASKKYAQIPTEEWASLKAWADGQRRAA
jgi:hypothetical protein